MAPSAPQNQIICGVCSWLCNRRQDDRTPAPMQVELSDKSQLSQQSMRENREIRESTNGRFSDSLSFYSVDEESPIYLSGEKVSLDNTFPMGSTVPHRSASSSGTSWSHCNHENFNIRTGPDYKRLGNKAPSLSFLYEPFGADVLTSDKILCHVAPNLLFPPLPDFYDPACGLPAIIIVNAQLPLAMPSPFSSSENDAGFSCIGYYKITQDAVDWAMNRVPGPPALAVLKRLLAKGFSEKALAFKAIGMVDDLLNQDLPMMSLLAKYNGKPVLVTASSKFHFGTVPYPYLEIDYNVRKWSLLARTTLVQLFEKLKKITVHVGYLVEATDNEDLPERMLAGTTVHNLDVEAAKYVRFDD